MVPVEEEEMPVPTKRPRNGEDSDSGTEADCPEGADCEVKGYVTSMISRYQVTQPYEGPRRELELEGIRERYFFNKTFVNDYTLDEMSDNKEDVNMNKENLRKMATADDETTGVDKKKENKEIKSGQNDRIGMNNERSRNKLDLVTGDISMSESDSSQSGSSVDSTQSGSSVDSSRFDEKQRRAFVDEEVEAWHEEIETFSYFRDIFKTIARFLLYVSVLSLERVICHYIECKT